MTRTSKVAIAILSILITYVSVNSLIRNLNPSAFVWGEEDKEEHRWLASSPSWFDRKACRWLGVCGAAHLKLARGRFGHRRVNEEQPLRDEQSFRSTWSDAKSHPGAWEGDERLRDEIPSYVLKYAPLVHLFSGEQFWPCDIAEHLLHITPMLNYTPIQSSQQHPTLRDLDELNQWEDGRNVFLTSNDNVEDRPDWLEGEKNIPEPFDGEPEVPWSDWDGRVDGDLPGDSEEERAQWYDASGVSAEEENKRVDDWVPADAPERGELLDELKKRYRGKEIIGDAKNGGRSDAPAVLVVIDKGNGIIDAFWFYFYSFNLGNAVLNVRFGNHVGDWEHCLVRFHNGKPKALFFSAHTAGEAYSYEAVEKLGERVGFCSPFSFLSIATCLYFLSFSFLIYGNFCWMAKKDKNRANKISLACHLLRRGHSCHVCYARDSSVRSSLWAAL